MRGVDRMVATALERSACACGRSIGESMGDLALHLSVLVAFFGLNPLNPVFLPLSLKTRRAQTDTKPLACFLFRPKRILIDPARTTTRTPSTWWARSRARPFVMRVSCSNEAAMAYTMRLGRSVSNIGLLGLERTDNNMELSSWPQIPAINQKNYYT